MVYCNYPNSCCGCYKYYPSYSYCCRQSYCPPKPCLKVEVINLTSDCLNNFQFSENGCDTAVGQGTCVPANGAKHLSVSIESGKKYDFDWTSNETPTCQESNIGMSGACEPPTQNDGATQGTTCYFAQDVVKCNSYGSLIQFIGTQGSTGSDSMCCGQSSCYQWFSNLKGNCLTIYVYPAAPTPVDSNSSCSDCSH